MLTNNFKYLFIFFDKHFWADRPSLNLTGSVLEEKRVANVGVAKEHAVAGLDMHYESSLYLNDV